MSAEAAGPAVSGGRPQHEYPSTTPTVIVPNPSAPLLTGADIRGASGAMIVEGLERAIPEVAGLPERVLIIRDLELMNPDAPPLSAEPVVPKPILDPDGDVANNNTGYGKPARDLSVNFVPAPYPDYTAAKILMRPKERQLWRVLNASAITYVHLTLLYDNVPQDFGIVALDGVPVNYGDAAAPRIKTVDHLTRATGQDGENDPNRTLASIEASASAREPPVEASGGQCAVAAAEADVAGIGDTSAYAQAVLLGGALGPV